MLIADAGSVDDGFLETARVGEVQHCTTGEGWILRNAFHVSVDEGEGHHPHVRQVVSYCFSVYRGLQTVVQTVLQTVFGTVGLCLQTLQTIL